MNIFKAIKRAILDEHKDDKSKARVASGRALAKRSATDSRQQRRRREFQTSLATVNSEFGVSETVFTIPRRARRKIARNRLKLAGKRNPLFPTTPGQNRRAA